MYTHIGRYRGSLIDFHYDENGKKHIDFHGNDLDLMLGLQSNEKSKWRTLTGKYIKPSFFDNIGDYYQFIQDHELNLKVYGNIDPIYQYINKKYLKTPFDLSNIRTFIIDIEVKSDKGFPDPETTPQPITSISIKDTRDDRFYVVSRKPYNKWKNILNINPKKIHFYHAPNEERLFIWFIKLMEAKLPDILIGWYSDNFDFPYIINRSYVVFGGDDIISRISPYGDVRCDANNNGPYGQRAFRNIIGGVYTLDYMRLYKKFILTPRESYSLDHISDVELEEQKLKFEEANLTELWNKNPQLYVDYNIFDVELISLLNDKLKLIDLLAVLSYKARVNFHDALGTVRLWDVFIFHLLKDKNIMIPPNLPADKEKFAGAYVKEPICDIYNWLMSIDLDSLYPHLHQQFNISPECLTNKKIPVSIDKLDKRILNKEIKVDPNYILAGNGCYFRKDIEGFYPKILREIYAERKETKMKMIEKKQELENLKNQLEELEK